jgi:hypothetical protein
MKSVALLSLVALAFNAHAIPFFKKGLKYPAINTIGVGADSFAPEHKSVQYGSQTKIRGPGNVVRRVKADIYSNACYTLQSSFEYRQDEDKDSSKVQVTIKKVDKQGSPAECNPATYPFSNIVGVVNVAVPGASSDFSVSLPINMKAADSTVKHVYEKKLKNKQFLDFDEFVATTDIFDPVTFKAMNGATVKSNSAFNPTQASGNNLSFKFAKESKTVLYADKEVLAQASDFFKHHEGFQETKEITIEDFDSSTMLALLEFAYTGGITKHEPKDWKSLFYAGDFFGIENVQKLALVGIFKHAIEKNSKIEGAFDSASPYYGLVAQFNSALPAKYDSKIVPVSEDDY